MVVRLLLLLLAAAPRAGARAAEIRLLAPGVQGESALVAMLSKARVRLAAAPGAGLAARLEACDVVLLGEGTIEALPRSEGDAVEALTAFVRRGGGLVVAGRAAAALPDSAAFARLLGRRTLPFQLDGAGKGGVLALAIPDQSHPVTQCVTHLVFERSAPCAEADSRASPLALLSASREEGKAAAALPRSRAVLWTRGEERGRVLVLALAPPSADQGAEERAALDLLLARGIEWAAGSDAVTVRIPPALPLAAERLGPGDAGILPGLPPAEGFYRGRQIAPVMTFHAADWLERNQREQDEQPEKVLDALGIEPGSTVVDLGAGTGYFAFRLARRVGPRGKVLAVEVQEEMLALLRARMEREGVKNIEPVLATPLDPGLPSGAADLVLMVDVYHELARPDLVLPAVRGGLAPPRAGRRPGRLVLVEYRGEDPEVAIKPLHRTTEEQVRAELGPLGFRWVETRNFLPHQHVLIFEALPPPEPPPPDRH